MNENDPPPAYEQIYPNGLSKYIYSDDFRKGNYYIEKHYAYILLVISEQKGKKIIVSFYDSELYLVRELDHIINDDLFFLKLPVITSILRLELR